MNEQELLTQQQLDQLGALFRDLAPQIAGYRRALTSAGVPEREVFALTMQLQSLLLRRIFSFERESQP